jgi:hypothetical protein
MKYYIHERANPRNKIHIATIKEPAAAPSAGGLAHG